MADRISEHQLNALEALWAKTTPGKWEGFPDEHGEIMVDTTDRTVPYTLIADFSGALLSSTAHDKPWQEYQAIHDRVMADAEFTGKAHQAVPDLIAALRAAYAELDARKG